MPVVNLYTTLGCHLCEQALALLHRAQAQGIEFAICEVEISESASLMDVYGVRIPVVREQGATEELGWPFDDQALASYLTKVMHT